LSDGTEFIIKDALFSPRCRRTLLSLKDTAKIITMLKQLEKIEWSIFA